MGYSLLSYFTCIFYHLYYFIATRLSVRYYQYRRLPCCRTSPAKHECTHIRLFTVLRLVEGRIEGTLADHPLPDATAKGIDVAGPGYHCLSYTWGNPFPPQKKPPVLSWPQRMFDTIKRWYRSPEYSVLCDGHTIPISHNLWNALVHMHNQNHSALRSIWIDQICINQRDSKKEIEKSSQVSSMHRIYEGAESVVVWLGPERSPTENLDLVMELGDELAKLELQHPEIHDDIENSYRFDRFKEQLTSKFGFEHWTSVNHFLARPYFGRMWVFQEVIVGKDLAVLCGSRSIPWRTIYNVSQAFVAFGFGALAYYAESVDFEAQFSIPHTLEMWRRRFWQDPERGLRPFFGGLVTGSSPAQYSCGVGHDMLYAHFGVCRYKEIQVDYSKSTEEVYAEFWSHVLVKIPDINYLTAVDVWDRNPRRHQRRWPSWERFRRGSFWLGPSLASWVPDFQVRQVLSGLSGHYTKPHPQGTTTICAFNVSGFMLPHERSLGDIDLTVAGSPARLFVSGYHISTIMETSETLDEIDSGTWCIPRLLQLLLSIVNGERAYSAVEDRLVAIVKTASIWSMPSGLLEESLSDDTIQKRFHLWLLHTLCLPFAFDATFSTAAVSQAECIKHLQQDGRLRYLVPTFDEVASEAATHHESLRTRGIKLQTGENSPTKPFHTVHKAPGSPSIEAVNAGNSALRCLRMFKTGSDHVGKGAATLRPGDEIWVFPGAFVPFILRRVRCGRHIFLGEAYVHGIMKGEMVEQLKVRERETVTII